MQAYTINSKTTLANGTSLKGYVHTTFDKLVSILGQPLGGSCDGKVSCEWIIEFEDDTVATIHDWKEEETPKDLYYWSVGGKSFKALDCVEELLGIEVVPCVY